MDNILVRSIEADMYKTNLEEAFRELRPHQMKLNFIKYTFEVTSKKFLRSTAM